MSTKNIFKYFIALLIFLTPSFALASRAGLVVQKQDGTTKTACVNFDASSISGLELLEKSGLNPISDNGFIVSIDGTGSKGSSQISSRDPSWSYWKYNGGWKFQNVGATYDRVTDGNIEGWQFSVANGKSNLPILPIEQICSTSKQTQVNGQAIVAGNSGSAISDSSEQTTSKNRVNEKANDQPATKATGSDSNLGEQKISDKNEISVSDNTQKPTSIFPKFNLGNILFVTAFFFFLGILFAFTKAIIKKTIYIRQHQISERKGDAP